MSLFLQVSSQTALVVLYSLLRIRLCLNTNDTTSAMFLRSGQIMILLTFTLSPAWSYLPAFYPLWHSNKPKAQLLDQLHALHNYSIIDTFPSSSLISHYSIIFNTSLLWQSLSQSAYLSLIFTLLLSLPSRQQRWLWAPHMTCLSLFPLPFSHAAVTEWLFFFFTWLSICQ